MTWRKRANRFLSGLTGLEVRRAGASEAKASPSPRSGPRTDLVSKIETPDYPPGAAAASNFFDKYSRFLGTSGTYAAKGRLNLRHEGMIRQNRNVLEGARVLDVASHDGRWSLAALEAGASHVIGIEARDEHVANAEENFAHYGVEPEKYRFLAGDIFEVLEREKLDVDVVLCLGFIYHTLRYNELLKLFRRLDPQCLIIDTIVDQDTRPVIHVWTEQGERERNAVLDRYSHGSTIVSGRPSLSAMKRMLKAYDFEIVQMSNWPAVIRDNPGIRMGGYEKGARVTICCRSLTKE